MTSIDSECNECSQLQARSDQVPKILTSSPLSFLFEFVQNSHNQRNMWQVVFDACRAQRSVIRPRGETRGWLSKSLLVFHTMTCLPYGSNSSVWAPLRMDIIFMIRIQYSGSGEHAPATENQLYHKHEVPAAALSGTSLTRPARDGDTKDPWVKFD